MLSLPPDTVISGRYKVLREIGRGAMGVVYLGEHLHTGERVALKLLSSTARLDPNAVARFKREARASAKIRSDYVVRVTDADTAPELDDSPFLVMELLEGTDLEKYITTHGPLEPAVVVAILTQVARALSVAHGLGIIHRDLKPENIFLQERPDGTRIAKVLDFGISKIVSPEGTISTAGVTATGALLGTPLYMSPEQAFGENDKIGPCTDVWAIGLVAFRLLTGAHYWNSTSMMALLRTLAVSPIEPPSTRLPEAAHNSPDFDAWFLRSCNRDHAERWPTVDEQVEKLAAALSVPRTSTIPSTLVLAPVSSGSRSLRVNASQSDATSQTVPDPLAQSGASTEEAPDVADVARSTDLSPMARSASLRPRHSRTWPWLAGVGLGVAGLTGFVMLRSSTPEPAPTPAVATASPGEPPTPSVEPSTLASPAASVAEPAPAASSVSVEKARPATSASPPAAKGTPPRPAKPSAALTNVIGTASKAPPPETAPAPPPPTVDLYNRRK